MIRSVFSILITPMLLLNIAGASSCMGMTTVQGLPADVCYKIIAFCRPTDRNALCKVCALLGIMASKNNIPALLRSSATYHTTHAAKSKPAIKSLLSLTTHELVDAVRTAHVANDQSTLELLKTYFYCPSRLAIFAQNSSHIFAHQAAMEQFVNAVEEDGVNKRSQLLSSFGYTLLHLSCQLGHPRTAAQQLGNGYEIFSTSQKTGAVRLAIRSGCFECARTLLLNDPTIVKPDFLADAIIADNPECVEFLLKKCSVSANQTMCESTDYHKDPRLESLLHKTVRIRAIGIMQQLLHAGADTTQKDSDGHTPLELARILLAQEPSENQKTSDYQKIVDILSTTQQ